jgi:hypothetical protein
LPQILAWADELRRLGVLANADTPEEAQQALAFGAQGIGLCRTEHMFFNPERLAYVREMLLLAPEISRLEREADEAAGDARVAARAPSRQPRRPGLRRSTRSPRRISGGGLPADPSRYGREAGRHTAA